MGHKKKSGLFETRRAGVVILLGFVVILGDAALSFAWPQTPDPITDVIYVSAQKRVERIQDVPISISAYSGDSLQQLGIETFVGLAPFAPGFQAHSPALQSSILTIRGIRSMDFIGTAGAEPRISIYQDGLSISRSPGAVTELLDIERIEVLKGPQGSLFGRAAEVGAIHIIQNKAVDEFYMKFGIAAGNLDLTEASVIANAPIISDRLYGRIAARYRKRDGYLENTDGADLYAEQKIALRGVLTFEPTDRLRFDAIVNYQSDDAPAGSAENSVIPSASGDRALGRVATMTVFSPSAGIDNFNSPRTVFDASLLSEINLSPRWTLTSISGYRDYDSTWLTDEDGTGFDFFQVFGFRDGSQWSQESRIAYDSGTGLAGHFGASVFHEDLFEGFDLNYDERQVLYLLAVGDATTDPILQSGNPVQLDPILQFPPFSDQNMFFSEQTQNNTKNLAFDVFAEVAIDLTSSLNVIVDGRWSYEDKSDAFLGGATGDTSTIGALGILTDGISTSTLLAPDTNLQEMTNSDEFSGFVWRTAVNWRNSQSLNLWASYAHGRRPDILSASFIGPFFIGLGKEPAETVDSFEIGAKGELLEGRVKFDGSVYYYFYRNFSSPIFQGATVNFVNSGRAYAVGAEGQIVASIKDNLILFGNYAFNESKVNDTDKFGATQAFAGNRFAYSPKHSFAVGAEWKSPAYSSWTLHLIPTFAWQSAVFFDDENRAGIGQKKFGLLNLHAEFASSEMPWKLSLSIENMLDKTYAIDAGSLSTAFGIPAFYIGPPRLWRVALSAEF